MKNQRQHWQGGIRAAGGQHRLLPAAPHPAADRASPMRMRHATAQPTSAEGRDPEGDPPRQSNRVRQYPRSRIRRASSAPRDRAALPRSGMRDHRGNAFDDGGSNCRGSTVIQRPIGRRTPSCTRLFCWSGVASICTLRSSRRRICSFSFSIFSLRRLVLVLSASEALAGRRCRAAADTARHSPRSAPCAAPSWRA